MSDIHELVPTLASLPRREYAELIKQVDEQRRQVAEREAEQAGPRSSMSKQEFAVWVARQHLAIDKAIARILYLPTGAPPEEVRLLEINASTSLPENGPVEAVDFMPDVEGIPYTLFVADATPGQFEAIRRGDLLLPEGWQLAGYQEILDSGP